MSTRKQKQDFTIMASARLTVFGAKLQAAIVRDQIAPAHVRRGRFQMKFLKEMQPNTLIIK